MLSPDQRILHAHNIERLRHLGRFGGPDVDAYIAVADHLAAVESLLAEMADALADAVMATPDDEEMLNVDAESVRDWLAKVAEAMPVAAPSTVPRFDVD